MVDRREDIPSIWAAMVLTVDRSSSCSGKGGGSFALPFVLVLMVGGIGWAGLGS